MGADPKAAGFHKLEQFHKFDARSTATIPTIPTVAASRPGSGPTARDSTEVQPEPLLWR